MPVVSVSHPNTGSGFGVDGVTDYKGRPGVFSKGAAEAFAKMITDSSGQVKGSDIASSQRSKSYNAHVGGVSNSNHLYGNALDIHGTSQTWMRANGQKYGWIVNDYPGSHGGHFNYKGAGASQMNTPDEGSPVATGQGGRALGSTTRRGGSSGGSGGPGKSSIVLSLKNGIQGKLDTATGKFTPAEFSPAERARYTQFGGAISEKKTKAKPQNKLLGALKGAVTGAALGGVFGGPLGALIGGVSGGVLGSGILSGQSDPNKPKRSDFPMGRSGAKEYASAMKNHKAKSSSTTGPSPEATKRHAELMNSKDPSSQKRIADYDAKHGEGAYSKELQKKLNKIYPAAAKNPKSGSPVTPTGKVVGRDKLSPRAQKALSRMDAQKAGGLQPDIKTSGPALGRLAMGAFGGSLLGPAGMMGGALLGGGVENIMGNISNAMTQYGGNVKDGNIGTPTAQEQKDFDNLAAKKEKLRVAEAKLGTTNKDIVTPAPPAGGGNNVKVVRAPSPGGGNNPNDNQTGGSDVDATSPGNGNKAKWSILGIPMPF
jgi:hypothetical protein